MSALYCTGSNFTKETAAPTKFNAHCGGSAPQFWRDGSGAKCTSYEQVHNAMLLPTNVMLNLPNQAARDAAKLAAQSNTLWSELNSGSKIT